MRSSTAVALLASGLIASVSASNLHAHHQNLHKKEAPSSGLAPSAANATCGCTTYTTTWYGPAGLVPAPAPTTSSSVSSAAPVTTSSSSSTSTSTSTSSSTSSTPTSTSTSSSSTSTSTSSSTSSTSTSTSTSSSTSSTPTSTSTSSTSSSSSSSSSTYVAPTTSSSTETTPSSTWVAPTSTWTPETSSTWVAPTTSSSSSWENTWTAAASSSWSAPSSSSKNWNVAAAIQSVVPTFGGNSNSASSNSGSSSGKSAISPNGNKWAMTYTPYNNDGSCKSASSVASDMGSIKGKGFTTVRLYATDCSGPQNVGTAARSLGLKVILGIYIDASGTGSNAYAQVSTLTSWGSSGNWDLVEMVVAGNEAIFNGFTDAGSLASFITDVKGKFQSAGYTGPVTTTEPLGTVQQYGSTLCPVVDVIAANIHPFFNPSTSASSAGSFVASSLGDLAKVCNNQKDAYNLETGWPWQGNANGAAVPGVANQVTAIESIMQSAGAKSVIFSFENDGWKAPGSLDVEQFWGCGGLFN